MNLEHLNESLKGWTILSIRWPEDQEQSGIEFMRERDGGQKTLYLTRRDCGLYIEEHAEPEYSGPKPVGAYKRD